MTEFDSYSTGYSTVSIHREYLPRLEKLKERHGMTYAAMVERLINRALADPRLLIPEIAQEPRNVKEPESDDPSNPDTDDPTDPRQNSPR